MRPVAQGMTDKLQSQCPPSTHQVVGGCHVEFDGGATHGFRQFSTRHLDPHRGRKQVVREAGVVDDVGELHRDSLLHATGT